MALSGLTLNVQVGGARIQRCPRVIVTTDRRTVLSRARIDAPDPQGELARMLSHGRAVTVAMGYRGAGQVNFAGAVDGWESSAGPGRDQITIHAAGPELPLVTTCIKAMYVDESADWIARTILAASGLPLGAVQAPDVMVPRMTLASVPVWRAVKQLAHTCRRAHGLDMSAHALWLDEGGHVHYGPHDDPQPVTPLVGTLAGLIRHSPAATAHGRGMVETFLLPVMRAGRRFHLRDARRGVDAGYRALRVEHKAQPDKARTVISYGGQ
jgi:hypothetical protein